MLGLEDFKEYKWYSLDRNNKSLVLPRARAIYFQCDVSQRGKKMPIQALTQNKCKERRRFTWTNYNGSIYVLNEGGNWGYIAASGKELIDLAKQILGSPDPEARNALDGTYETWSSANPYQLADLLYKADKLFSD